MNSPDSVTPPRDAKRTPARGRILIAEDNQIIRQCLYLTLVKREFEVVSTADGQEALQAVSESATPFDCLITDHDMPRLTGLHVVRQLMLWQNPLPVLVLSGSLDELTRKSYGQCGVYLMLDKPSTGQDIIAAIEALIAYPNGTEEQHQA